MSGNDPSLRRPPAPPANVSGMPGRLRGRAAEDEMSSGMRAVAKRAGVAMSSVSRVLSGHPDVSSAMRGRVLQAVEELHYKPDLLAQGLRRRETMTVGFVAGDISNPVNSHLVKGVETRLREAGYSLLLTNSLADPELDRSNIELLQRRRADGLILLTVTEQDPGTIEMLEQLEMPVVMIERTVPESVGASQAYSDHRAGVEPAVEHLLDLGHRAIAFVGGQNVRPTRERRSAIEAVFAKRGFDPTYEMIEGTYSVEHGEIATGALLDRRDPPTAIIAGSNQITLGALRAISARNVELGTALSFVGCDDVATTALYRPPVAVVTRDTVALGRAAADLLLRRMRGDTDVPETVTLPSEFVPRPSCGAPRTADPSRS